MGGTPDEFRKHMEAEQKRWTSGRRERGPAEMSGRACAMIHTEEVVIASEGSRRFDGHFARPASGAGPGLLIFSEMWGVAPKKREMAEDYARRGWCAIARQHVLAVGVHRRRAVRSGRQGMAAAAGVRLRPVGRGLPDRGATGCAPSPHCNGKIAAIGFCMGGRIAFLAASRAGVDAAVGLYALGIAKHLDEVRSDGRAAPAPLRPERRAHPEIRDRRGRRCRSRQPPISRSSFIRAPGTASSTGRSRPTM